MHDATAAQILPVYKALTDALAGIGLKVKIGPGARDTSAVLGALAAIIEDHTEPATPEETRAHADRDPRPAHTRRGQPTPPRRRQA